MIAIDTNVLVHALRSDSIQHARAAGALRQLAQLGRPWAVPWPCVHELLAVATNPRSPVGDTPLEVALDFVGAIAARDEVRLLGETPDHWAVLSGLLRAGVRGPRVHDARIAAICLAHGVEELWTADRDFSYFPELRTRNPLI